MCFTNSFIFLEGLTAWVGSLSLGSQADVLMSQSGDMVPLNKTQGFRTSPSVENTFI